MYCQNIKRWTSQWWRCMRLRIMKPRRKRTWEICNDKKSRDKHHKGEEARSLYLTQISQTLKSSNLYYNSAQSLMVLLNGPPLSNFVDRGLGEWSGWGLGVPKSAHAPPKWALSVVTQHSDVFITETRFTQHGPVLISGCRFALCTSGSVSHNTAGFDIGIPFHTSWQGRAGRAGAK
jgi:hypothetical protein